MTDKEKIKVMQAAIDGKKLEVRKLTQVIGYPAGGTPCGKLVSE